MKIVKNNEKGEVNFAELKVGDCFKDDDGDLMMKLDKQQKAVDLSDGCVYGNYCGDMVIPVNAEIHIID